MYCTSSCTLYSRLYSTHPCTTYSTYWHHILAVYLHLQYRTAFFLKYRQESVVADAVAAESIVAEAFAAEAAVSESAV